MAKMPFKASEGNFRLTDFSCLRDFVVSNSVRSVPSVIRQKQNGEDGVLSGF